MSQQDAGGTEVRARDQQTFDIIGAALEVHRVLGVGFLESVYQEALTIELDERLIPFKREVALPIQYKWAALTCSFRADFICFDEIIIELKVIRRLSEVEHAQVINYLKATGFKRALLFNFGSPNLEYKRFINTFSV